MREYPNPPVTEEDVAAALVNFQDDPFLAESPLCRLYLARRARLAQRKTGTTHGWGPAVRQVILDTLAELSNPGADANPDQAKLYTNIIQNYYIANLAAEGAAGKSNVGRTTLYRHKEAAIARLRTILLRREAEAANSTSGLDHIARQTPFVGRSRELSDFFERLRQDQRLMLQGDFGIGKTSLAAELAFRANQGLRTMTIWYNFLHSLPVDLDSLLLEFMGHLAEAGHHQFAQLIDFERTSGQTIPASLKQNKVLAALRHDEYLLVFDNIDVILDRRYAAGLEFVLALWTQAYGSSYRILIVGREVPYFAVENAVTLEGLALSETKTLFQDPKVALPDETLSALHQAVAGNPFLLRLASAFLRKNRGNQNAGEAAESLLQDFWRDGRTAHSLMHRVMDTLEPGLQHVLVCLSIFREPIDDQDTSIKAILKAQGVKRPEIDRLLGRRLLSRSHSKRLDVHPALREFIIYQQLEPETHQELTARLGAYWLERNDAIKAAYYYLDGEHYTEVIAALGANMTGWLYAGQARAGLGILRQIPTDQLGLPLRAQVWEIDASVQAFLGDRATADRLLHQALAVWAAEGPTPSQHAAWLRLTLQLGHLNRASRPDLALGYFQRVLADATADVSTTARARIEGAGVLYYMGQHALSREWAMDGSNALSTHDAAAWLAQAENVIAHTYIAEGRADLALPHYERGLALSRDANDKYHQEMSMCNSAIAQLQLGAWQNSSSLFEASIALAEEIGDLVGAAATRVSWASLLVRLGRLDIAKTELDHALDIFETARQQQSIGIAKMNLGLVAILQGQPHQADNYLQAGLTLLHEAKADNFLPEIYRILAMEHLALADTRRALERAMQSEALAEHRGLKRELGMTYRVRGDIYLASAEWSLADAYFKQALIIAQEAHDLYEEALARLGLAELCSHPRHPLATEIETRQRASEHAQTAHATLAALGAQRDLAKAKRILARLI